MSKQHAVETLALVTRDIEMLTGESATSPEFQAWHLQAFQTLYWAYGGPSQYLTAFNNITYTDDLAPPDDLLDLLPIARAGVRAAYEHGLSRARSVLLSALIDINSGLD